MATIQEPLQQQAPPRPAGTPALQTVFLLLLVFISGMTSLAVELSASRLLAPYFGTSLIIWANLIGLILIYLTAGYYLGGVLSDRFPRANVLYRLTTVAAFAIGLVPFIGRPILRWALIGSAQLSVGIFLGSLFGVILLFALPVTIMGTVSPYAIRLLISRVEGSGHIAGQVYALSTAGSIIGTFLPVFLFIPTIGTSNTFLVFAFSLLLISLLGLLVSNEKAGGTGWGGRSTKTIGLNLFFLLLLLGLTGAFRGGLIKPVVGAGSLLTERESAYNYIQVVQNGPETELILNDGHAIHSIYNPQRITTGGPWDYFLVASYFNAVPYRAPQVHDVLVIGLAGGTVAREYRAVYGNALKLDGVEIDPTIVDIARKYFALDQTGTHVIVQDGRYYIRTTQAQYDVIGIDAYQQPYIPFQLTTREFFQEVHGHLRPNGVAIINAGRTATDFRLVNALAGTMKAVFSNVYIIDSRYFDNSLIIGTNSPTALKNFAGNAALLSDPTLREVAQNSIRYGNIREQTGASTVFTDDRAPVEQVIDQIILGYIREQK